MTLEELRARKVARGRQISVTFAGNRGSQVAVVVGYTRAGRVVVLKYRAASKRWTKPISIHPSQVKAVWSTVMEERELAALTKG